LNGQAWHRGLAGCQGRGGVVAVRRCPVLMGVAVQNGGRVVEIVIRRLFVKVRVEREMDGRACDRGTRGEHRRERHRAPEKTERRSHVSIVPTFVGWRNRVGENP